ncbi:MAG: hypothetical protein RLZZ601_2039 [Pseudomonadota bacterium]|jgi:hypothetical protein
MNTLKTVAVSLMLGLSIFSGPIKAENEIPVNLTVTGTISVNLKVYALALGQTANTSTGVLTFQGKKYPFTVRGIGLNKNQIGASHLVANGEVFGLEDLSAFEGSYFQISGGITGQNGQSTLRNDNKVWLHLKGWSNGPVVISDQGTIVKFSK